jgi:hypothetical protein
MRHPLGFVKITLLSVRGCSLRLHVWTAQSRASHDRHDHRWSFVSVPLWGWFLDTRWARTHGSDLETFAARHPRASREHVLDPTGRGALMIRTQRVRSPLLPYVCRRGEIHSYWPLTRRAASLVLTGRPMLNESQVWRPLQSVPAVPPEVPDADERDPAMDALIAMQSWDAHERAEAIDEAVDLLTDMVVKCTEYGTQDDGFVAYYILPTGPVHRAIPWLEERGIIVRPGFDGRKRSANVPAEGTEEAPDA